MNKYFTLLLLTFASCASESENKTQTTQYIIPLNKNTQPPPPVELIHPPSKVYLFVLVQGHIRSYTPPVQKGSGEFILPPEAIHYSSATNNSSKESITSTQKIDFDPTPINYVSDIIELQYLNEEMEYKLMIKAERQVPSYDITVNAHTVMRRPVVCKFNSYKEAADSLWNIEYKASNVLSLY